MSSDFTADFTEWALNLCRNLEWKRKKQQELTSKIGAIEWHKRQIDALLASAALTRRVLPIARQIEQHRHDIKQLELEITFYEFE